MSYAAHESSYRGFGPPIFFWHPFWIVLTVLAFIFWWPIGLIMLGIAIGSRKMGCWGRYGSERWQERMHDKMDRMRSKMESFGQGGFGGGWGGCGGNGRGSSGNRAFDEYRTETLRRLEEEQREFREFLQRLRMAKDKAEFDQFMTERRNHPAPPPQQA